MKTCITYARESIKDQSHYSLDEQVRECAAYGHHNGLKLLDSFIDKGQSSYTFDRADFNRLEEFIKQHRPDYLVVKHLDRFSRNMAEAILKIREYGEKYGIKIRAITERLDMDDNSDETFLNRTFTFMTAERELRNIRRRTRDGLRGGALQGRFLSTAPYAYINARDERNKPILLVDPIKSVHVQYIFRQYLAGAELVAIRKGAAALGYRQKGKSCIPRILGNPVYAGLIRVGASATEKEQLVKGLHAPLVSEMEYWAVQDMMNSRSGINRQLSEDVPLRGVLRDGEMKFMTSGNSRGRRGIYYQYYVGYKGKQWLSARKMHEQFNDILHVLSFREGDLGPMRERVRVELMERNLAREGEMKRLQHALKVIGDRIATVGRKYLETDAMPLSVYNASMAELNTQKTVLERSYLQWSNSPADYTVLFERVFSRLGDLRTAWSAMPVERKHSFVKAGFYNSLAFYNGCYRTPRLHPLFADKTLELKEKGLLVVEQPFVEIGQSSTSSPGGT